jgi:hypothetical protein
LTATTTPPVPDWLAKRAGALQSGVRPETRFVLIGGQPLYKLEVRPAVGQFACAVTNSANGHRLDDATATYASADAALTGGLEQLRAKLGW